MSIVPGQMASTRIPSPAYSTASCRVKESTPPLLAAYAGTPFMDCSPCTLALLMIAPPPRRRISGMAYLAIRK